VYIMVEELALLVSHCAGRAGRKRYGQHVIRVVHAGGDTVGDTMRDGTGFPGASTGQDTDWSVEGGSSLTLFSIKPGQNVFRILQSNSLMFWVAAVAHRTSGLTGNGRLRRLAE